MTAITLAPDTKPLSSLEQAFARYHAAWEANDPDRIADLHSADSWFWLHDGSPRVEGRENLRRHYVGLFEQYESIGFETRRILFGEGRWIFDYTMVLGLTDASGAPFIARLDMIDVVDVNGNNEVTRKDVFLDTAEANAALRRAGRA